eukprot:scaffold429113_cov50-Prasinocladus_malaysianus.AAC.2
MRHAMLHTFLRCLILALTKNSELHMLCAAYTIPNGQESKSKWGSGHGRFTCSLHADYNWQGHATYITT